MPTNFRERDAMLFYNGAKRETLWRNSLIQIPKHDDFFYFAMPSVAHLFFKLDKKQNPTNCVNKDLYAQI